MSKDKLEKFIDDHRCDFDDELPQLDLWNKIEQEIHPKPKTQKRAWWTVPSFKLVATLTLFVVVIAVVGFNVLPEETEPVAKAEKSGWGVAKLNVSPRKEIIDANPELGGLSNFYTQKISDSKSKLVAMGHEDPDLLKDLAYMESMFDSLQAEWNRNPHKSDEHLVRAMIANYRTRANLLENIVRRVEANNTYYRRQNRRSVPAFTKGQ